MFIHFRYIYGQDTIRSRLCQLPSVKTCFLLQGIIHVYLGNISSFSPFSRHHLYISTCGVFFYWNKLNERKASWSLYSPLSYDRELCYFAVTRLYNNIHIYVFAMNIFLGLIILQFKLKNKSTTLSPIRCTFTYDL